MSQHEVEALVESSIRLLATSDRPPRELRSLYFNLFEYEALFDTGFTHFRTLDELVSARFVYALPLEEHPDFFAHQSYFQKLKASGAFAFLEIPGQKSDGSYYQPPHLYFDAGSGLWQRLVELGRLSGPDAERPEPIELLTMALEIVRLAESRGDVELVATWYRLLVPYAFEADFDELRENPTLAELREIVKRTNALSIKDDYGMLRDPQPADYEEFPLLKWWFELEETDA
jgi:hypothetical protein